MQLSLDVSLAGIILFIMMDNSRLGFKKIIDVILSFCVDFKEKDYFQSSHFKLSMRSKCLML